MQLQISWAPMIAQLICTCLHVVWCYIFIIKYNMEVFGAGFAMALSCILMYSSVTILSHRIPRIEKALFFPTMESLEEWGEYLAISIPATIMICASWWGFELFVIISSNFGTEQMAAMVISQHIAVLIFMLPIGLQESICSMVGSAIGANNVQLSKQISRFTFILSLSISASISILLLIFKTQIANIFTTDKGVRAIMYTIIPINALVFLPDAA